MLQKIIELLKKSCYGFCVLTILYTILMMITYNRDEGVYLSAVTLFLFFPLCFLWAFAADIKRNDRISGALGNLLHYGIVTAATLLCLYLPHAGGITRPSTHIVVFFFWTVGYIVVRLIISFIYKKIDKNKKVAP